MFEYVKVLWSHAPDDLPIVIMYEIDLQKHRKANRAINVYATGYTENITDCYEGTTQMTPIPTVDELNHNFWGDEIRACNIEKAEFLRVWGASIKDTAKTL